MNKLFSHHLRRFGVTFAATAVAALVVSLAASATLGPILVDPFTNPDSQHKTVVEPDTYSAGSTIVAVAQMGQFTDEGASGIGFATTTNNAASWTSGVLPAITQYQNPAGPYDRVTDASVAFDARHNVWIAASLGLRVPGPKGAAVIASRSTNGGLAWTPPVTVAAAGNNQDFEKPWIVCDDTATSPFYGSCYAAFDDHGHGNAFKAAYSRDGGLTWTLSSTPNVSVIGVQPLALPNGKVIVIFDNPSETTLGVITSGNGGVSFGGGAITITSITAADDPGNIRSSPLPSAEIDGAGKVFVAWEDCRFRAGCPENDLVYTTSTNGTTWTAVQRIPTDPGGVGGTQDTFTPGMGVDKSSSTPNTRVTVTYYYFPNVSCTFVTCQLDVGFISSSNGGTTWTAQTQLAGPMKTPWLPLTNTGRMFGDYISTSYGSDGLAHPVIVVAHAPPTGDCATSTPNCDVALYG